MRAISPQYATSAVALAILVCACTSDGDAPDGSAGSGATPAANAGAGSGGIGGSTVAGSGGSAGAVGGGGSAGAVIAGSSGASGSGGLAFGGGGAGTAGAGGAVPHAGSGGQAGAVAGTSSVAGTAGAAAGGAGGQAGAAAGSSAAGAGGGPAGGAGTGGASSDGFTLVFRDDFDALDLGRWQLMTHSWDTNLALFSASAVSVQNGLLRIMLTPAPSGTVDDGGAPKSFLGAEVRSRDTVNYGRVRARARLASGSAVVSALVTIYTPWPADDWNELDIECLGQHPSDVQFNAMVYTGPPVTPPATQSVTPTQHPQIVGLGFDPSLDFHEYTIEWTPAGARFVVDGVERHAWTERIERFGLPQNTLLTIWASSSPEWAGPVNSATGQASASYDWVELYSYAEP